MVAPDVIMGVAIGRLRRFTDPDFVVLAMRCGTALVLAPGLIRHCAEQVRTV